MMKIQKLLLVLVGLIIGVVFAFSVSEANSSITKTFSSDDDFSHWSLTKIETIGSNTGIQLEPLGAQYQPFGKATYKFAPGGVIRWQRAAFVSEGTGLDVQFSTNNTDFSGIKADGSFSEDIGMSTGLYLRVKMTGGATTPILRSLTIEYEIDSKAKVIIEKRVYRCVPSSESDTCQNANQYGQAQEEPTFEPGDIAGVSLKINSATHSDVNFNLRDYLPSEAVLPVEVLSAEDRYKYCHIGSTDSVITGATADTGVMSWENQTATTSDKFACYRFGVGEGMSDAKNKNNFKQVNAIAYRSDVGYEKIIGSTNSYLLVRGFPFTQSLEDPSQLDTTKPFQFPIIEDELGFTLTKVLFSSPEQIATSSPSYVYIRGAGQKSRGGTLVSLPVKMTDITSQNIYFEDQFYLLYNPIFYLFGNMFSGSSSPSTAFDFGHGSSSISSGDFENEKLNSVASLYNYHFDQKSVLFWDRSSKDKNATMERNIKRIIGEGGARPDNLCIVDDANDLKNNAIYLNNRNCRLTQIDNSRLWPTGRVWYLKTNSDVEISSRIVKGGTLVVDYSDTDSVSTVRINTNADDFKRDSFLGLIVINGGRVEFTQEAEYYRGIVFVPGRSDNNPSRLDGEGRIVFAEDGSSLQIRGSIIADEIDFSKRQKDANNYAVSISSDSQLINARIPGFEKLMDTVVGK